MNAIDKTHFEGLCEVIGVKPSDLLLEPLPSGAFTYGATNLNATPLDLFRSWIAEVW